MKKRITSTLLSTTGLGRLLSAALPARGILVLNYHRIGDGASSPYDRELWSATDEGFDAQVAFLARNSDVISPSEIETALAEKKGRHVIVTFDDGYLDNYELAFPTLRRHGVPATFFIATGFIDNPSLPWWDEIAWLMRNTPHAKIKLSPWFTRSVRSARIDGSGIRAVLAKYKSLPAAEATKLLATLRNASGVAHPAEVPGHWMNWDMVREMAAAGMTIGGHTVDHPVLSRLPRDLQRKEITGCAERLLAEVGTPMEYFAYPVGNRWAFNEDTRICLQEAGVKRAFSYYGGYATASSSRYDMPRVAIERHVNLHEFDSMVRLPQVFCRRPYA